MSSNFKFFVREFCLFLRFNPVKVCSLFLANYYHSNITHHDTCLSYVAVVVVLLHVISFFTVANQYVFKITIGFIRRSEFHDVEGQGMNRPFGLFRLKKEEKGPLKLSVMMLKIKKNIEEYPVKPFVVHGFLHYYDLCRSRLRN